MDNVNVRRIEIIIEDLLSEFEREGGKLQAEYDDNATRILEIDANILNFKESEDVDFKVFSPRKIDNQNEEKINSLKVEKQNIELTNKSLYRQLRYYSDKIEKLNEILSIIKESSNEIEAITDNKSSYEDITHVDEKILEYYDSIVEDDIDSLLKDKKDNRSGWRIIKDEIDTPISSLSKIDQDIKDDSSDSVYESLISITSKLETESKAIDDDYFRTKEEIRNVLNDINNVLEKLKK